MAAKKGVKGQKGKDNSKAKKEKKVAGFGVVHVKATFNNTIVTVTDKDGNVVAWSSAGVSEFKGSRKSTSFAAQLTSEKACQKAYELGVREAEVRVKGPGMGRESAIRAVETAGIKVKVIKDVTPIPHNGCRPKKRRRV